MIKYSINPIRDKETREVLYYTFKCEDTEKKTFGVPHIYGNGDFIKIHSAEDAITILNFLNDMEANKHTTQ